jgi:hypothetical protein
MYTPLGVHPHSEINVTIARLHGGNTNLPGAVTLKSFSLRQSPKFWRQRQHERNSTLLYKEQRPDLQALWLCKCRAQNGKTDDHRLYVPQPMARRSMLNTPR